MLFADLHANGWDRPQLRLEANLTPPGTDHLPGTRASQNSEL